MNYYSIYNESSFYGESITSTSATIENLNLMNMSLQSDSNQITTGTSLNTILDIDCQTNRIITFPSTISNTNVVLTDGNQTINNIKTIAGQLKMNALTSGKLLKLDDDKYIVNDFNVYITETQLNTILLDYVTLVYLNANHYTKTQIDTTFNNYYTKTYIDNTFLTINNPLFTGTLSGSIISLSGINQYPLLLTNTTGMSGIKFTSTTMVRNMWLGTGGFFNFDGHIIPSNNNLLDLGATTNRYRLIYTTGLNISGTITTPLTASQLIQTNASSQLISSNTLPSGCLSTNMTLTTPIISDPSISGTINVNGGYTQSGTSQNYFTGITNINVNNATLLSLTNSSGIAGITFNSSGGSKNFQLNSLGFFQMDTSFIPNGNLLYNFGSSSSRWNNIFSNNVDFSGTITTGLTASRLIQTNASSQLISSNTLPSGCSSTNMTLLGTITTGLTTSSLIQTNGSSQLTASNTLPASCLSTNMTLTTPKIITSIDANTANNDDIGITTNFRNAYLRQMLRFNRVNNATPCMVDFDVGNARVRLWSRYNGDTGLGGDWMYQTYNYFVDSNGTFTVDNALHRCSRFAQSASEFRFGWSSSNATVPNDRLIIDFNNALYPATNTGLTLGRSSFRWGTLFGSSTIDMLNTMNGYLNNSSDAMQILTNITPGTSTLVNSTRSGSRINLWQGDASNISDFSIDLSTSIGGSPTRALTIRHNIILPNTNNYIDLGSSTNRMKNIFSVLGNFTGTITTYDLIPATTSNYNVGSSSNYYNNVYTNVLAIGSNSLANANSPNAGSGIGFYLNGAYKAYFTESGFLQITGNTAYKSAGSSWTNPSDLRLKQNIEDFNNGLETLINIQPRKFEYKNNPGNKSVGIIAQEILNIYPDCINVGSDGYYQYDSNDLLYILINSVKELKTKNDLLEQRLLNIENLLKII